MICQPNYIGNFSSNGYVITSCVLNTDTIPVNFVSYQNISPKFGKFLSVQTCSTSGQIPILFMFGKSKTFAGNVF